MVGVQAGGACFSCLPPQPLAATSRVLSHCLDICVGMPVSTKFMPDLGCRT